MYILIDPISSLEIARVDSPMFVIRDTENGGFIRVNEFTAEGLFYNHVLYRINNRQGLSEEIPPISYIWKSTDDTVIEVSEAAVKNLAYIDYLSAMTGIDLPDEEEV